MKDELLKQREIILKRIVSLDGNWAYNNDELERLQPQLNKIDEMLGGYILIDVESAKTGCKICEKRKEQSRIGAKKTNEKYTTEKRKEAWKKRRSKIVINTL